MRLLPALVFATFACGQPASSESGPAGPQPAAPAAPAAAVAVEPVEQVATRFARAALAGDRATALSLVLTFEEMARVSRKAGERGKHLWDDQVTDFVDGLVRAGREGDARVVSAKVVQTMTLTPSKDEKVLRNVDVAIVQLVIGRDGGEVRPQGVPLLFLKTATGWRFSPTQ